MSDSLNPLKINMVDLQAQYQMIKEEVEEAFAGVLDSCWFINGQPVRTFASNLADYLSVSKVIPCGNGTDALQIALMALDLQPGDEVITTPFTFVATAEVIALLRLKPVFVDVNPDTFNIDESLLESAITSRTRCIIPVHLFGQGANMEAIMDIANQHDIFVVEDNAQAIGADFIYKDGKQKKLGTIGHIGCTSFFPSKNLGAYGDAGALFTNDEALGEKIQMVVNHGMKRRYYHDIIGVNSRLDSLQAAVLDIKLKYLNDYNTRRKAAAHYYNDRFKDVAGIITPFEADYSSHVYHQYTLKLDGDRDAIREKMNEAKIPTGVYYPVPLHIQKAYKHYGYNAGDFPISEQLAKQVLSLPMHSEMKPEIQDYIADQLLKAMS